MNRQLILQILRLALALATPFLGRSAAADERQPQQWAVIITVGQHENEELHLKFALRDGLEVRRILVERGGVASDHILEMNDASSGKLRPTKANTSAALESFLNSKAIRPDDRVVVYYSGHAILKDNDAWLVPVDFNTREPTDSGIALSQVHDALKACPAHVKLLVLDCCHAGGLSTNTERVAEAFRPDSIPGALVLASCRRGEFSFEWDERKQSLFTYWLCRALEGGADSNGDGDITFDELYAYTSRQVSNTARVVFQQRQSPVRLINLDVAGDPVVLTLRPEEPETLCRRLAEHLDLEVRAQGLKHVGVLEFVTPVAGQDTLPRAALPRYLAERIQVGLMALAGDHYAVSDRTTTSHAAAAKGIGVRELSQPGQLRKLAGLPTQGPPSIPIAGPDAILWGRVDRRQNGFIVQCELLDLDSRRLATPSGVLRPSEELLGDSGLSFNNRRRPAGSPTDVSVVAHVKEQSQTHPLQQNDFPFRIEVHAIKAGRNKSITAQTPRVKKPFLLMPGTDGQPPELLIAASDGELYEIRVWNNFPQRVAMSLLIDGINTLGRNPERLGKAWSWVLEPTEDSARPQIVDSWYLPDTRPTAAGQQISALASRFKFVDVSQSLASRKKFTDSLGVITAAFYAERGRALGTGEGPSEQRELRTINFKPGRLLGVVHIRYVDAFAIK